MKKMKPRLLCSWSFILGFSDGIPNRILNIKIFKISVGDFVCEIKLKFSIRTKKFRNPSKYYRQLFIRSAILSVKE
jgi:hypothetical protein